MKIAVACASFRSFCRSSLSLSGSRENFSLTFLLVLGILVLGDDAVALLGVASGILSSKDSVSPFLYPFSPINAVTMYSVFFFVSTAVCTT